MFPAGTRRPVFPLPSVNPNVEVSQSVHVADQVITLHNGGDARGGAGHDQIARAERDQTGKEGDCLRDIPDQLIDITLLPDVTIHRQGNRAGRNVTHRRGCVNFAHRCRSVEAFRHVPRASHILETALHVAPCHIEAHAISENGVERLVFRNSIAAGFERDDHLYFRVHILRLVRIGRRGVVRDNGVGGFREEEWRITIRVMAHLARMRRIVPANAEDAMDREGVAVDDWNGGRFPKRDSKFAHDLTRRYKYSMRSNGPAAAQTAFGLRLGQYASA